MQADDEWSVDELMQLASQHIRATAPAWRVP
jgi:hypothetical protein